MRIGHGYDVHRLGEGRKLILGGVEIPYSRGLIAHSDGDVLIHAVIDSLLGAMAMGDIGRLFPDTDDSYKNIDSMILFRKVIELLNENGYKISNIDATIIAQKPKISPYIEQIRLNISSNAGIDFDQVNVKATTEEKLGFTGREEGISAHSVCIIFKK